MDLYILTLLVFLNIKSQFCSVVHQREKDVKKGTRKRKKGRSTENTNITKHLEIYQTRKLTVNSTEVPILSLLPIRIIL